MRSRRPAARPAPEPTPDRSALDAAERALGDARGALEGKLDEVAADREALERRAAAIKADSVRQIVELEATRDRAREEYDKALRASLTPNTVSPVPP